MKQNIGSIPQVSRIILGVVGMDAGYYNHSYFWCTIAFLAIASFVFSFLGALWASLPNHLHNHQVTRLAH
jgi:uncharacterized membrane protein YeaQ/YmgE (transglycosylase-associated protein family)